MNSRTRLLRSIQTIALPAILATALSDCCGYVPAPDVTTVSFEGCPGALCGFTAIAGQASVQSTFHPGEHALFLATDTTVQFGPRSSGQSGADSLGFLYRCDPGAVLTVVESVTVVTPNPVPMDSGIFFGFDVQYPRRDAHAEAGDATALDAPMDDAGRDASMEAGVTIVDAGVLPDAHAMEAGVPVDAGARRVDAGNTTHTETREFTLMASDWTDAALDLGRHEGESAYCTTTGLEIVPGAVRTLTVRWSTAGGGCAIDDVSITLAGR